VKEIDKTFWRQLLNEEAFFNPLKDISTFQSVLRRCFREARPQFLDPICWWMLAEPVTEKISENFQHFRQLAHSAPSSAQHLHCLVGRCEFETSNSLRVDLSILLVHDLSLDFGHFLVVVHPTLKA